MKKFFIFISFLLLLGSSLVSEPTSYDGFHESVRQAYLSGDKNKLKNIIQNQRSNNPSDIGAHLLEIYYYTIFEADRGKLSRSLEQFENKYPSGKAPDSDLSKSLGASREILAMNVEQWDVLERFPVSEGENPDPIYMLFLNPARGLSIAQASGRIETVAAVDSEAPFEEPVAEIPPVALDTSELFEAVEPVTLPEPATEKAAEVKPNEVAEEAPEQSSQWWLWLIGAVIVVGGLGVVVRRKS